MLGCTSGASDAAPSRRTLVVGYGADESPLALNRDRLGRYPLNANICEPLVRLASDFSVIPALAARWDARPPNTMRFVLRQGVRFSDGSVLDARAAAATLTDAVRSRIDYTFLADSSVTVVDDSTLDVRPGRVNHRLADQLVHPTYGIVKPGSDRARQPVCTGPFRLVAYLPHDHLTVVRNERFRGPRPRLDTLVFRYLPDETTRALALRAGEVDAIVDVGAANAAALARVPGVRIVAAPPGAVLVLYLNRHGAAPFQQLRDDTLRRAIAMAIDRNRLVASVVGSGSTVAATVNPPAVLGPDASRVTGVPHDPAGARALLRGRRPTLRLIANPNGVDRAVLEFVQAELARVGMTVQVDQLDAAAYESRLNAGSFDLDLELPSQNDANPAFLLALRWYGGSGTRSVAFTHASARFDTLVERSLGATSHEEARRRAAEAMHQLVDVEVGAIPLAGISRVYALRAGVAGFVPHPSRLNQDWTTVHWAP